MSEVSTTTAPDTESAEKVTLPPVECTPWCHDGSGHTDAYAVADQWCHGETTRIDLTAENLVVSHDRKRGVTYVDQPLVDVSLGREAYSIRTLVSVVHNERDQMDLTGAEAIALGEALVRLGREALA